MKILGFEFAKGARFQAGANADPDAVGIHLEFLRAQSKGELTPEDVLNDAKNDNSPLHSYFEWDDGKAAHQHRLRQARGLIRAVVAVYVEDGKPAVRQRAYVHIPNSETPHYRETTHAMSQQDTRELVLKRAWSELQAWRSKYADLKEFAELVHTINKVKKRLPEKAVK